MFKVVAARLVEVILVAEIFVGLKLVTDIDEQVKRELKNYKTYEVENGKVYER
jgi:hypothetical protein